jgi:4-hydroxy-tetrahydrodipicolinate synthase
LFSGSIVALVTPFRSGTVDLEAIKNLIEWHVESGTDGIVVCGSTGEGMLLSDDEREVIISTAVETANKRIPIIVGCSACWTAEAVRLVTQAERLLADGALVVAPYYVKPTQSGIIEHFKAVLESCSIPVIVYNNPGRCSVNIAVDTIVEIAKFGRIVLKDSDTNLTRVTELKSLAPQVTLLSGDDATLVGYLAHGGDGCISVAANVEPTLVKQMITAWGDGDVGTVQQANAKLANLNKVLFIEANPIPVKYILSQRHLIQNELRLPLLPASVAAAKKIDRARLPLKP